MDKCDYCGWLVPSGCEHVCAEEVIDLLNEAANNLKAICPDSTKDYDKYVVCVHEINRIELVIMSLQNKLL